MVIGLNALSTQVTASDSTVFEPRFPPSRRAQLVYEAGVVALVDRVRCVVPTSAMSMSNPDAPLHLARSFRLGQLSSEIRPVIGVASFSWRDPNTKAVRTHQRNVSVADFDRLQADTLARWRFTDTVAKSFGVPVADVGVNWFPRCEYLIRHPYTDWFRITVNHKRELYVDLNDCLQTLPTMPLRYWLNRALSLCVDLGILVSTSPTKPVIELVESLLPSVTLREPELAFDVSSARCFQRFTGLRSRFVFPDLPINGHYREVGGSTVYKSKTKAATTRADLYNRSVKDLADLGTPIPVDEVDSFQRSACSRLDELDLAKLQVYRFELRFLRKVNDSLPSDPLSLTPDQLRNLLIAAYRPAVKKLFRPLDARDRWAWLLPSGQKHGLPTKLEYNAWFDQLLQQTTTHLPSG